MPENPLVFFRFLSFKLLKSLLKFLPAALHNLFELFLIFCITSSYFCGLCSLRYPNLSFVSLRCSATCSLNFPGSSFSSSSSFCLSQPLCLPCSHPLCSPFPGTSSFFEIPGGASPWAKPKAGQISNETAATAVKINSCVFILLLLSGSSTILDEIQPKRFTDKFYQNKIGRAH